MYIWKQKLWSVDQEMRSSVAPLIIQRRKPKIADWKKMYQIDETPGSPVVEYSCLSLYRTSAYFLAEIPLRSPRKLFIFVI